MKLAEKQAFLVVRRLAESSKHVVRICDSLPKVLTDWTASTRTSPLLQILGSTEILTADPELKQACSIFFVGPIAPWLVPKRVCSACQIWLALGAFNVVVLAPASQSRLVRHWAREVGRYERWKLQDGIIVGTSFSAQPVPPADDIASLVRISRSEIPVPLRQSVAEYCTLTASALARSACAQLPELEADLHVANAEVLAGLTDGTVGLENGELFDELGILTNTNAGVARLGSQALSGISPLFENESDLKLHSLLGTGVANLAIARIRRFVERTVGAENLPERVESYAGLPCDGLDLTKLRCTDDYWDSGHIGTIALSEEQRAQRPFPLLAYFSETDHFKSTFTTLSAPVTAISSCNSLRWSLLTLTHEICHTIVRGILASLLPDANDEESLLYAVGLLNRTRAPQHLLDEITRYLLLTIVGMDTADTLVLNTPHQVPINSEKLRMMLNRWHHEVEELMVHLLDFLYFYDSDEKTYIPWIWLSWGVIPNVGNRVPEYVLRTLCALVVTNLRRGPLAETTSRDQFLRILGELKGRVGDLYIEAALQYVEQHWDDKLFKALACRKGIVKIVRAFLYSPTVASEIRKETKAFAPGAEREGYPLLAKQISPLTIDNPLRFLKVYTTDLDPSPATSAWILYTIAFNMESP